MDLTKEVEQLIEDNTDEGLLTERFMTDLMHGGCSSGMVSGLIYYSETIPFYHRHKLEISGLLVDMGYETGLHPHELLVGWDDNDPLALDDQNQNLLAWFGFEETCRKIADENGIEY
jgi:hypothetical protein